MNILGFEIEVGTISILGIAAVLAIIVIRQVVSRQSDRIIIKVAGHSDKLICRLSSGEQGGRPQVSK